MRVRIGTFHNVPHAHGLVSTRVVELFIAFNELPGAIKHDLNELVALTYPSCQLLDPSIVLKSRNLPYYVRF